LFSYNKKIEDLKGALTAFVTGKYDILLDKYGIQSSLALESIPATPIFSSPPKTKL
jgi:hypothetical protein